MPRRPPPPRGRAATSSSDDDSSSEDGGARRQTPRRAPGRGRRATSDSGSDDSQSSDDSSDDSQDSSAEERRTRGSSRSPGRPSPRASRGSRGRAGSSDDSSDDSQDSSAEERRTRGSSRSPGRPAPPRGRRPSPARRSGGRPSSPAHGRRAGGRASSDSDSDSQSSGGSDTDDSANGKGRGQRSKRASKRRRGRQQRGSSSDSSGSGDDSTASSEDDRQGRKRSRSSSKSRRKGKSKPRDQRSKRRSRSRSKGRKSRHSSSDEDDSGGSDSERKSKPRDQRSKRRSRSRSKGRKSRHSSSDEDDSGGSDSGSSTETDDSVDDRRRGRKGKRTAGKKRSKKDRRKKQKQRGEPPLRILCIDGGGVKGLVPAIIVERIEEMCGTFADSHSDAGSRGGGRGRGAHTDVKRRRVRDLFDLVCGTSSAGGLIVLATCASNLTIEAVIDIYERRSAEIFCGGGGTRKFTSPGSTVEIPDERGGVLRIKPKHSPAGLEKILKECGEIDGTDGLMNDAGGMEAEPKVFVVAASRGRRGSEQDDRTVSAREHRGRTGSAGSASDEFHPHLFRNYAATSDKRPRKKSKAAQSKRKGHTAGHKGSGGRGRSSRRGSSSSDDSDDSDDDSDDSDREGRGGLILRQVGSSDSAVWQAARATSASPGLFPAVELQVTTSHGDGDEAEPGVEQFVDGAVCANCNNPIELAMNEIQDIWPGRKVGVIVSIGCGAESKTDDGGLWEGLWSRGTAKHMAKDIPQLQGTAVTGGGMFESHRRAMQDLYALNTVALNALSQSCVAGRARVKEFEGCRYYRLSPMLGQPLGMDSVKPKELSYLRQCTESFLAETKTQRQLREIATLLLEPDAAVGVMLPVSPMGTGTGRRRGDDYDSDSEAHDDIDEQLRGIDPSDFEKLRDYQEGSEVRVFSRSAEQWFEGTVIKVEKKTQRIAVEYLNTVNNQTTRKSLEFGSRDFQLVDKHKQEARLNKTIHELTVPEPEPEPEPDDWSDRHVDLLEDDDGVPMGPPLPPEVQINKHQMEFKVCVFVISFNNSEGLPVCIRRRYKEFEALRNNILSGSNTLQGSSNSAAAGDGRAIIKEVENGDSRSGIDASPFPGKTLFGRLSKSVIASRQEALAAWLNALLNINESHQEQVSSRSRHSGTSSRPKSTNLRWMSQLLREFLELKDRDTVTTRQEHQIMVVIACDCEVPQDHTDEEAWHYSSPHGDGGPPVVRDGVSPDSRALGWLCPGMCVQVLREEEHGMHKRLQITWKGANSVSSADSRGGKRGVQEMWVTHICPSGRVLLADVDQRDWVNVEDVTKRHWPNVMNPPRGTGPVAPGGLLPMTNLRSASSYTPAPSVAAGGESTPQASPPTEMRISPAEKDTLFDDDSGPIVAFEWSTDGKIAPLDWEVQWGYRWSGGWLTARPYRLETMLDSTEVVVHGSGQQTINGKMQWHAQLAVGRLAKRSGGDATKDRCVVRVRALGVTGWGTWSATSSALTPILCPRNPLDPDHR